MNTLTSEHHVERLCSGSSWVLPGKLKQCSSTVIRQYSYTVVQQYSSTVVLQYSSTVVHYSTVVHHSTSTTFAGTLVNIDLLMCCVGQCRNDPSWIWLINRFVVHKYTMEVHHNIPQHTIVVHHSIIAGSVGYWSVLAPPVYYLVNHFPPVCLPLLHTLHATPTTPQLLFIITNIPKRQLVHPSLHHSTPSHLFL